MFSTKRWAPVLALAFLFSVAHAADEAKMSDEEFAKKAAMGGMFEVKAGKLATDKGSAAVRSFGTHMIIDHGKAGDELKALAAKKGWTLPDKLDAMHQEKLDRFAGLNQADFDREYIAAMKDDHQMDFKMFHAASQNLSDPDLRAFAGKTLTVVEQHRRHVEGMTPGAVETAGTTTQEFTRVTPLNPDNSNTVTNGFVPGETRYYTEGPDGQRVYVTDPNFRPCLER